MRIAMIGAGYVGLVSSACFAEFGADVICVDREPERIAALRAGKIPIFEPGLQPLIADNMAAGRLCFTTDLASAVADADAVFIAVGTPSRRGDGHADLSFVFDAAREIAASARQGAVIVTKSTVPVGHAYTTLACDALARFKRLDGYDVHFLTGTDEHGQKVEKAALDAGVDPQAFTDGVSGRFRQLAEDMGFTNDDFIRTTEPRHIASAQAIWRRLIERDEIYLGAYKGWYAIRDEAFYAESELTKGPDGEKLAPTGAPVEWVEEPSYFFRLSAWQDKLLKFYDENPDFIAPQSRRNEVISFVKGGLLDLSVSRASFKWGVPVPDDPDHVMYVWLDALTNYITAAGFPDVEGETFKRLWPADVHMVGKDILRFHAVYWPAFLMAAELEPPKRVFAHGWWTNEGKKISKSLGNVIKPHDLVEQYGLDQTRYFLLREVPFGNDGDFSRRSMVGRMNSELANDYGNLAQRALSMIAKNLNGVAPQPGPFSDDDNAMLDAAGGLPATLRPLMDAQTFHEALEQIWVVIRAANVYVDRQAPWALRKTDPDRMATVLYVLAETIRRLAIMTQPFMPDASAKMLDAVASPAEKRTLQDVTDAGSMVEPGAQLPKPTPIFPRYQGDEDEDEAKGKGAA